MDQQVLRKWIGPVLMLIAGVMVILLMAPGWPKAVAPDYSHLPHASASDPDLHLSRLPVDELLRAPESIVICGKVVKLRTGLYRNFMPHPVPRGTKHKIRPTPTLGTLTLYAVDESRLDRSRSFPRTVPLPDNIIVGEVVADEACLVLDGRVWATSVSFGWAGQCGPVGNQVVARITNGPEWQMGVGLDVVVRIVDADGAVLLLRAANQKIRRAD